MQSLLQWRRRPGTAKQAVAADPYGIISLHIPSSPDAATVDIVLIHGLKGHREKTWTASGAVRPWPATLLPPELPTARVLTFGYDASLTGSRAQSVLAINVNSHAWNFLTSLAAYRERDDTNDRPILFVCHSLGGLVCEDALVKSKERAEPHLRSIVNQTRGIVFLGTPHHGTAIARWAELMSPISPVKQSSRAILQTMTRDSEVLARIQDSFHSIFVASSQGGLEPIQITCFYEELSTPWVGKVVPTESAVLPGCVPIGIHSNHRDIAKYTDSEDLGFVAVCAELRRWTKAVSERQRCRETRTNEAAGPKSTTIDQDRQPQPADSTTKCIVPYSSNPDFVGRSDILDKLKEQLGHSQQTSSTSQARVSIYGLGGVGKTQIALAYVFWIQQTFPKTSIFWVHGSNVERFRQAYVSIAQEYQIPGYSDPRADVLPLVKAWLDQHDGRWLMVVDNADDGRIFYGQPFTTDSSSFKSAVECNLAQYLPDSSQGAILVTTGNKQVGVRLTRGQAPIEVPRMSVDESENLLRARLRGIGANSKDLSTLASRLEHLPLALAQSASFILETSITVNKYLELLSESDQNTVELLTKQFDTVGRDSEAPHAVAETWFLSFRQIEKQYALAHDLFSFMSVLDRNGIPTEFLLNFVERQGLRGSLELTEAIGVLKAFCFVTEESSSTFAMHRLVQLVARKWLVTKKTLDRYKSETLLTVSYLFPRVTFETRTACSAYLAHAYAVLNYCVGETGHTAYKRGILLDLVALYLGFLGHYSTAAKMNRDAMKVMKEQQKLEKRTTMLRLMNHQAMLHLELGQLREAEELQVNVVDGFKEKFGDDHPSTLRVMSNLAVTYWDLGRREDSEKLHIMVLEARSKNLGADHLDTLKSMIMVSRIHRHHGRLQEAETLLEQALEGRKRRLGADHPDTLLAVANLATVYLLIGRQQEAENMQVEVLETFKRTLGAHHKVTLVLMQALAWTWKKMGRAKEAASLKSEYVDIRTRMILAEPLVARELERGVSG